VVDHSENPIGRLFLFLTHSNRLGNVTCLQAWTSFLDLPPEFSPTLWRAVAEVQALPGQAHALVGRYDGPLDTEAVLEHIRVAANAVDVASNLNQPVQNMHVAGETLMALKLASSVIGPSHHEPTASAETRDTIRYAANDLIDTLRRDDSIPVEVKRMLFDHAEAILHALNLVDIGGASVVIDERDRLLGRLVSDSQATAVVTKNPSLGEKVLTLLNTFLLVGNLMHVGLELPHDLTQALAITSSTPGAVVAPGLTAEPTNV
jgi:hypothetical protein